MMRVIFFFLLCPFQLLGQNTIGFPDIVSYPKQIYKAGLQNWDIKQDSDGIVYIANNEGLLVYNGNSWSVHPLPNKTIVRSVEVGKTNRIYVGGQDELGYFSPSDNGTLVYHSLVDKLQLKDRAFGDVWDIVSYGSDVYFRSLSKIFRLSNRGTVQSYTAASEWSCLAVCNDQLYAHDQRSGILKFELGSWIPLSAINSLPLNIAVTSILPLGKDSSIVTTLKNGLFVITRMGVSRLAFKNEALFINERIYAADRINKNWFVFATSNRGIYITDKTGEIIQHFSRTEGLQNNNVLSVFKDNQNNLWLGLDNGIDFIAYNSSIKQIKPLLLEGSGYTAIIKNNRLYLGTSKALFSVSLQNIEDLSFSKGDFSEVVNSQGQTWSLTNINDKLLLGHHEGAFLITDNQAQRISDITGVWNFKAMSTTVPASRIIAGDYKGLTIFNEVDGRLQFSEKMPVFNESSRYLAVDANQHIWVSHPYHGVFKIEKTGAGQYKNSQYDEKRGLPSQLNNHIFIIKNEVLVATEKGIYVYDYRKDRFAQSAYYTNILGQQSVRYLKEDVDGNIWFVHEKTLGVIDYSKKEPELIYLPELNNKILSGFEYIYPYNKNNIFLGGEKGFFLINYEKYKKDKIRLTVQVRSLRIIGESDSLVFGGYYKSGQRVQDPGKIPAIKNHLKTIRFEFTSPVYGHQSNLEFSFRLRGYDDNWSEWTGRTEKDYTNLPPGKFRFEVKVRNNLRNESGVAGYSFRILPPWYKSNWAKLVYVMLLLSALFFLYYWQQKKFKTQQKRFNEEQQNLSYIHELEMTRTASELVTLRNEKLESEINFKNSELASSAMHLVHKSELVSKIKGELSQVIKQVDNPLIDRELKKMIKKISEDDNTDNEWEKFTQHFDKVHSDFIVDLKTLHPNISNNEVKLCAYLRMNLSTKEISKLLNISVRGVEVSRYRLRKKLGLATETNLFHYLINIQNRE